MLLPAAEAELGLPRVVRFGQQWVAHMVDTAADGGCFFCATWSELQVADAPMSLTKAQRIWVDAAGRLGQHLASRSSA